MSPNSKWEKRSHADVCPDRSTVQTASLRFSPPIGSRSITSAYEPSAAPCASVISTRPWGEEEAMLHSGPRPPDSKFSPSSTDSWNPPTTAARDTVPPAARNCGSRSSAEVGVSLTSAAYCSHSTAALRSNRIEYRPVPSLLGFWASLRTMAVYVAAPSVRTACNTTSSPGAVAIVSASRPLGPASCSTGCSVLSGSTITVNV